ncbi:DoxX family membrane protein [Shimia sagamensis]|uniref:Oxidoreductase n=1 Tax=Shimia sagamensis TaxID=1566352 RepID=A0ABY1NLF7_9RHOB|nr:DoxX family membrane protein [Shimia sagamensis]SMP12869.1 putative oxidoreductase [Shimia sagamensis]
MSNLITLYQDLIDRLSRLDWLVPTLARLTFLMVLFFYFWNSAMLKIDGSIFSPSAGAFGQIFPKAAEAVVWDVSQMNLFQRLVIFAGTVAEFVLPVLILLGLLTRLAAIGMIGFIAVQTIVDVTGHGVALGSLFDSAQALIDQRMMWVFLFAVLVLKGAGPLSLDALFKRRDPA